MSADEPGRPDPQAWRAWPTPPGVPDGGQLALLVDDAAARAAGMLATGELATGELAAGELAAGDQNVEDALVDAVRLLATPGGAPHAAAAARLTGVPEPDLRRLVLAYRHGGPAGAAAALAPTPCEPEVMAAAVGEVRRRRAFSIDELATAAGEITDAGAGIRLRLGPDGRWYPFTLARAIWWPAAGAHTAAATAYQAAVRARSLRRATG